MFAANYSTCFSIVGKLNQRFTNTMMLLEATPGIGLAHAIRLRHCCTLPLAGAMGMSCRGTLLYGIKIKNNWEKYGVLNACKYLKSQKLNSY